MPVLWESQVIGFYTFLASAFAAAVIKLTLRWPFLPVYLLVLLTVGPTLAILRGRDRSKDKLNVAERAVAEIIALIELILVGSLLSRWIF